MRWRTHWRVLAVAAGVWAALAGCAMKLAINGPAALPSSLRTQFKERVAPLVPAVVRIGLATEVDLVGTAARFGAGPVALEDGDTSTTIASAAFRLFCLMLFFYSNARMWVAFTEALDRSQASIGPTIATFVANTVSSVLLGMGVFMEIPSRRDVMGTVSMIVGAALVLKASKSSTAETAPPPPPPPPPPLDGTGLHPSE